ncbi:MAG: hypothetical protein GWP05_03545 [Anaerolineaceae bacterium]|nr:hypothetical protein [Anaerolineaceae bacterium]
MSSSAMTSRERVLAAIARRPTDYVPCSPAFNPLTPQQRVGRRWQFPWGNSRLEMVDYCVRELGVDPLVAIPVGGFYPRSEVTRGGWLDGEVLRKVWTTPAGLLINEPFEVGNNLYVGHFQGFDVLGKQLKHDLLTETDLKKIFVAPDKGDYRLKADSPAIDAGLEVGMEKDRAGTKVPQGKAPDIGAYEYVKP